MASGLSSADIEGMRTVLEDTVLPGTVVFYTRARVADGQGGWTNTYTAAGTVAARLDYRSDQEERAEAGGLKSIQNYVLTTPHDTAIADTGRIVYDGGTFEVTASLPQEPWTLCERTEVVRID